MINIIKVITKKLIHVYVCMYVYIYIYIYIYIYMDISMKRGGAPKDDCLSVCPCGDPWQDTPPNRNKAKGHSCAYAQSPY